MALPGFRHFGLKLVAVALAALIWLLVSGEQIAERAMRIPLEFANPGDYDGIERDDVLDFEDLRDSLAAGAAVGVANQRTGARFRMRSLLSPRERDMLLAGGLLAQTATTPSSPPHPTLSPSGGEGGRGSLSPQGRG